MTSPVGIRPGTVLDVPAVLAVADAAVRWLVAQGNTGQWGTQPFSSNPKALEAATTWANSGGLYVADIDTTIIAALAIGQAPAYVPPATEPEVYINLLVTDHSAPARGVGSQLLQVARDEAQRRGICLLRVDCYAGHGGALVGYYLRQGFTATDTFTVNQPNGPWPGQVLQQRLEKIVTTSTEPNG